MGQEWVWTPRESEPRLPMGAGVFTTEGPSAAPGLAAPHAPLASCSLPCLAPRHASKGSQPPGHGGPRKG